MQIEVYKYCSFFSVMTKGVMVSILFLLSACDSSTDIPIQQVDQEDKKSQSVAQTLQQKAEQKLNPSQAQTTYYFGFDLRSSPQEDVAQYLPFLTYLEKTTGYRFKLHFTPKGSSTADELGKNKTQFASMGASSYLDAHSRFDAVSLVRGINHRGKAEYQSVLVTRPNSKIKNIAAIEDHRFAFGGRDSTQGHLIPRIMMIENDLTLKDLKSYAYTGSHQNCAEAVVAGKYDVCGMQDQLGEKLAARGLLKIIHRSDYYPSSGIVANNTVPKEVMEKVKQALINFYPQGKHRKGLHHWDQTEMPRGFAAANDNDYSNLRKWSIRFGFLKLNKNK